MASLNRKKRIAEIKCEEREVTIRVWDLNHPILSYFKQKLLNSDQIHVDSFTKRWINRLMWFSCFWISMSYYLVLKGYGQYAESLSQTVCVTVIGAMIPYLIKSFFETYFEKKNQLDVNEISNQINQGLNNISYSDSNNDDNMDDIVG